MPTNLKYSEQTEAENLLQSLHTNDKPQEVTEFDTDPFVAQGRLAANLTDSTKKEVHNTNTRKKLGVGKFISIVIILICFGVLSFGSIFAYSILNNSGKSLGQGQNQNFFDQTKQFFGNIISPNSRVKLAGEAEGRTNILVVGTDAAAGLTDTMMIASYFHQEKKITTVNIPRDTLAFDGFETSKLNAVYNNAIIRSNTDTDDESKQNLVGVSALSSVLGNEFNIPLHYWVVVNFSGVTQIVDELGGVEIDVKKDLYDNRFPNDNYQFVNGSPYKVPAVNFKAGVQTMNGRDALIYARSRETTSDFDRSERQSIVIQSILQKIKTKGAFENISKVSNYLNIVGKNFRTNMKIEELFAFNQISKDVDIKNSFMRIVWNTENGIICMAPESLGFGSSIYYCDGGIIGKKTKSKSRDKAQAEIQNILIASSENELLNADVVFVGNQSSDTEKAFAEFEKIGFSKMRTNNVYSKIKAASANSIETTTIYIPDARLRDLYKTLSTKPEIKSTLKESFPAEKKLPRGFEDAQIIVWVE